MVGSTAAQAVNEEGKDGRAEQRGDDADRDFALAQGAGEVIDDNHVSRAEQHRAGQEALVVGANQHPPQVRDDKLDPTDATAHRHLAGDDQSAAKDDRPAQRVDIDVERARFAFAQGEQVEPPAQAEQHRTGKRNRHGEQQQFVAAGAGKAAHQPEDDAGQGVFGVGEVLQQADQGGEQAAEYHASEDKHQQAVLHDAVAGKEDENEGGKATGDGAGKEAVHAEAEEDGKRAAKGGTGGNADDVRINQRVAEDALQGYAGERQPRFGHGGGQDARQAHLKENLRLHGIDFAPA